MPLRPCASGCGSFLASLDGHDRCLMCLGREHAEAAFTDGTCVHCERMSMAALKSRRSFMSRHPLLSSRGKSLSRQGFSATTARHLGDIQVTVQNVPSAPKDPRTSASPRGPVELSEQYTSPYSGLGVSFGAPQEIEMSAAASEGESDGEADNSRRMPNCRLCSSEPPGRSVWRCPKHLRLVPLGWMIGIWGGAPPRSPPVPFFPEVHETWRAPHSSRPRPSSSPLASLDGGAARGYEAVPQVERAVAVHLCPPGAATWRDRPHLPSRACEFSSALAGRTYHAAGQAATALHAMATLQVYQAKVLKHLHERGSDQGAIEELRAATDFALRATKVTARSGQVMSTIVVQERHLWLTLAQMADVDKSRFLDAPVSQGGLFGDTVEDFGQQFSAVQKQTEAIKHILPRRDIQPRPRGPNLCLLVAEGAPPWHPNNQLRPLLRYMTPDWQPDVELPASQGPVTRKRSAATRRLPHCGHVGQRPFDTPGDQAGSLASASQPLAVVDSDGTSRLCDSVRQASAQVQRRPFHFCPFRHTCRCASCGGCSPTGEGRNRACPSSRDVLQSLLHRSQKERWVRTHPGSSSPESVPSQAAVQDAHDEAHANIPGELNRAADQLSRQSTHPGEWRLHPETVQLIWSHFGGAPYRSVCFPRILPLPAVLLPQRDSQQPRQGRTGTQLTSGAQVRLSPSEPFCTDTVQDQGGRGAGSAGCAILAHPDLVPRTHFSRGSPSLENPLEERPSFSGDGHNLAPAPRPVEPARLAPGRDASDLSGLPQAVIETITQSRAPSTRQAYALRWGLFVDWCSSRGEDPQRCTIAVVLSFQQEKLEHRLSPSTLKVYVAAIAAYHDAVDGTSLGKHQLIVRFLRGARRVNPPRPHPIRTWDLSVALQGLQEAPFEPLASVELKYLSLKTALLTALASIRRVGDLQAFSVDEACLEFGPGDSHVILRPRPGYVPKVPTTPFRDQVVNLQALPLEEADPASALLCPVCALRIYMDRTRHFRRTEQLFVCFGGQQKGNAVSKQRLAHWVVDAISLSYQNQGEPCPLGVHAHSTRSVASSYALAHGASLADIYIRRAGDRLVSACCATPTGSVRYIPQLFPPVNLGSSMPRKISCAPPLPNSCFSTTGIPVGPPYWPPGRWEGYAHIRLLTRPPVGTRETAEGERLGYVRNPRSLKEGTETLHPLPRPYVALTPGCSSAPQQKPE
ncbi:Tyrosine recombinase slr0733 [Labeo rohita]|uniref:Tyrosine recombinase slr0733 n=1 Tax=Labeo rohita TaxID=84645 RepID=A0ABQ8MDK9_LABRO|nr:Tyrosine recombinase slr0733 [Labeo rohita]